MILLQIVLVFFLAFLLSLYGTPFARQAAIRFGIVDRPDGRLKLQRDPVPYMGGLSIFISFLVSLALVFDFEQQVLGLLLGGCITVLLGLIDDFGVLTPRIKFFGQILAAVCLIKSGIQIHLTFFPDQVNIVLTLLWLVGITNAFNIIDIMDGLSCGTALIASIFLLALSILNGNEAIATMTAALAGSLLGFLRYNYHPAQIYMGDAGSLFIGLMLGAFSLIGQYTFSHRMAFLSPVILLGIPIYDTVFVMVVRLFKGRSPFLGSRDHIALRLRKLGLTVAQTVNIFYATAIILGNLAFVSLFTSEGLTLFLFVGIAIAALAIGIAIARVDMESA